MNLASEVGISLEDLAKIVVRQTNSSTEIKCLSEVQTINVRVVAHKAKVKLGWQAKTSVQEIVDECRII